MGNQVNAEFYEKEIRRLWITDTRSISKSAKRLMETNYENIKEHVFVIEHYELNPYNASRHWEHTVTIKTPEAGGEKEWWVNWQEKQNSWMFLGRWLLSFTLKTEK